MLLLLLVPTLSSASTTFSIPPVITAGEPATIEYGFSKICKQTTATDLCSVPNMKLWLAFEPDFRDGHGMAGDWTGGCLLEPCIWTNLSNFNITVPRSAVPDGGPYGFAWLLYTQDSHHEFNFADPKLGTPDDEWFNVTGSNTSWTEYDKTGRFYLDNSKRGWYNNMTCETYGCARQCAQQFEAPLWPNAAGLNPDLDACVQACPGWGQEDIKCVTQNAVQEPTVTSRPTPTTSSSSTGRANSSATPTPHSLGVLTEFSQNFLAVVIAINMLHHL